MQWLVKSFEQLTTTELYDCLKLRSDVFVVEQDCVYPDLDDLDKHPDVKHVFIYQDKALAAYSRLLPPKLVYPDACAIGRVVVSSSARQQKLGRALMRASLEATQQAWPTWDCQISAQEYLLDFYFSLGFEQVSEMYLEDGIPHISMRRKT